MADGTLKPIADVDYGDMVWATDPETGEAGPREVTDLIRHSGPHTMVRIQLVDGTTLDATDKHPFWNPTQETWVDAISLHPGDHVLGASGQPILVTAASTSERDLRAYNLTVDDIHNYHVGGPGVLVHNCGPGNLARVADEVLPTPQVGSAKLQNIVDNLYKATTRPNRVGKGTTMDAIRSEKATGLPTGGRMHTIKGQESLRGLNKWMGRNPGAPYRDRLVAQSLADELRGVLAP